MMARVLVTGGCGFIGSHLVEILLREGFLVRVLDLKEKCWSLEHLVATYGPRLEILSGDICDIKVCERAVQGCELVSHLAALISVDWSIKEPRLFWETNVGGTFNIIEAALNARIRRFHYASSCEVYGNILHPQKATEDSPTYMPRSPYAASKLAAEAYCKSYWTTYGFPVVITRSFNVFGPRQNPSARGAVIAKFIVNVLENRAPYILGQGNQERDWTYVSDIAEGIYKTLVSQGVDGECINLCSGEGRTVKEVAHLVIRLLDKTERIHPVYGDPRPGEVMRSVGSFEKALKILHWSPKTTFETGLRQTIQYFSTEANQKGLSSMPG